MSNGFRFRVMHVTLKRGDHQFVNFELRNNPSKSVLAWLVQHEYRLYDEKFSSLIHIEKIKSFRGFALFQSHI